MKVWEVIAALSKLPAGAEVYGRQLPHDYGGPLNEIDSSEAEGDAAYVEFVFDEHEDNE